MKTCERCGKQFGCDVRASEKKCWCLAMPPLKPLPAQYKDCLCSNCLQEFRLDKLSDQSSPLKEGEDFYYEKGLFVFTEKYHLDRGYCCGSGCRHCPY